MPFNPDEFLAKDQVKTSVGGSPQSFDPNAWLTSNGIDTKQFTEPSRPATEINPGPAQAFLDMAMPLTRYAEASGLKAGGQANSISEGLDIANKAAETAKASSPIASKLAAGVGLVTGGFMGGLAMDAANPIVHAGIARLTANETAQAAVHGIADLAGLALEGGSISVLNDQPKSFEDALHSFSAGATIAGALGLAGKGAIAGGRKLASESGSLLASLDEQLSASSKAKQQEVIGQAEKGFNIKQNQVTRQEDLLSQRQNELAITQSHAEKVKSLVSQEPFINDRVSQLPNKINDLLDQHLQEVGEKKSAIVQQFANQRIDPTSSFKTAIDNIDAYKAPTPQAEGAKQTALNFIKQLDQRLFDNISPTDSLVGIRTNRDTNVGSLDKMHDQLQELLYDRGFLEGAPKGSKINDMVKSFERDVRTQLNNVDPTGNLASYNEAYHSLKNARSLDGFADNDPTFFMQKAKDPNNPKLIGRYRSFEENLIPDSEGGALGSNASQNIDLKNRFRAIRGLIQAESEPAMLDYKTLQEVKPQIPSLENKILNLETSVENSKSSLESRKLASENAGIKLQETKDETPQNTLEALLPAKLRAALHFKQKLSDNEAAVDNIKQSIMSSPITDYAKMGGQALARGAITRLPSTMGYTKNQGSLSNLTPDNSTIQPALRELR